MNADAVNQLVQVLEKTTSGDQNDMKTAQQFLEQAAANNLPELIRTLSDVLYHGGNSAVCRQQAGVQLKNFLYTNDESLRAQYEDRWLNIPEDVRVYTKQNVVGALGTESFRPSAAAQCVHMIAVVEIPRGCWPGLITTLVGNVTNPASTEMTKESTLQAIGYVCQDVEHRFLEESANEILTAIVHGMRRDETSSQVRLAATRALNNSLEFTKANFDKDAERHYIMQVVCEATQSEDCQIKVAALQCLVRIMTLYYQYMETYMGQALFAITLDAMKHETDEVALQGIEFWSNVCDEEVDLQIEASEATEAGRPPEQVSRFYAKGALQFLVPELMVRLTKQDEYDDEDDWNPCKAAGVCMMLLATCCEDDIVPHVLPFVKDNIRHPDWKHRDAALMSFGSILEGPDPKQLKPLVEQALPIVIELMADNSVVVKDTSAWTLGRVCELIPDNEKSLLERLRMKSDPNYVPESKSSLGQESSPGVPSSLSKSDSMTLASGEPENIVYNEPDDSVFAKIDLRTNPEEQPEITDQLQNVIVKALTGGDKADKVVSGFRVHITRTDLFGLTGENWINDKIVEMYMQMVAKRSVTNRCFRNLGKPRIYCMSTFFFLNLIMRGAEAVSKWTKDVDIFSFDVILIPIHLEMHWCVATVDFRAPGVFYYDSMGGHNMPALSAILEYLRQEHIKKKGSELDLAKFAKEIADCPQQQNGADCGIFACKVVDFISREAPVNFSQEDMPYFRKRMIWEIVKQQLLTP